MGFHILVADATTATARRIEPGVSSRGLMRVAWTSGADDSPRDPSSPRRSSKAKASERSGSFSDPAPGFGVKSASALPSSIPSRPAAAASVARPPASSMRRRASLSSSPFLAASALAARSRSVSTTSRRRASARAFPISRTRPMIWAVLSPLSPLPTLRTMRPGNW